MQSLTLVQPWLVILLRLVKASCELCICTAQLFWMQGCLNATDCPLLHTGRPQFVWILSFVQREKEISHYVQG